jgi:hypothetical protein
MVTAATDMLDPAHPRRVLLVTSNPTVSKAAAAAKLIVEALGQ